MTKKRLISYIFLLINTLCWGAALVIVKPFLTHQTPMQFLFYRYLFASVFSIPFIMYYWRSVKQKTKTILTIAAIEIIGTTGALGILYTALSLTGAVEASLLGTTGPIFIILASVFFLREKQEKREWLGLGVALAGTILLTVGPIYGSGHQTLRTENPLFGNFLMICYNIVNALYYILAKKYYHKTPKLFVASISFIVGLISFAMLWFAELAGSTEAFKAAIMQDISYPWFFGAALYMAIFGSIIGLTAYIKGQDGIEASEASLFTYLQPLVFIPLGFVLLGEKVGSAEIIGTVIVIAGVCIAEWRGRRSTLRSHS